MWKRRWKPNAAQRAEYRERMLAIENAKTETVEDGYDICCTGDCVTGDDIAFFNAGKSSERLYGVIIKDSYGKDKQQHTFTIEVYGGDTILIKGRNLYKNGVMRKSWENEDDRVKVLDEKHERGNSARAVRAARKEEQEMSKFSIYED